ncbi:MAG: hypothetical protein WC479_12575 [Candidatus Izemoplasmatales bacterium]
MKRDSWIVTEKDERPAGDKGECFYCKTPLGGEHKADCPIRVRTIVASVTITFVDEVPENYTAHSIEFRYNDSSWCAGNILDTIQALADKYDGCLCGHTEFSYIREATKEDEDDYGIEVEAKP